MMPRCARGADYIFPRIFNSSGGIILVYSPEAGCRARWLPLACDWTPQPRSKSSPPRTPPHLEDPLEALQHDLHLAHVLRHPQQPLRPAVHPHVCHHPLRSIGPAAAAGDLPWPPLRVVAGAWGCRVCRQENALSVRPESAGRSERATRYLLACIRSPMIQNLDMNEMGGCCLANM